MRELIDEIDVDKVKLGSIVLSYTQEDGYEAERNFLIDTWNYDVKESYIVASASHCSCYDFDDTYWEFTAYNHDELIKIAKSRAEDSSYWNPEFWKMVLKYLEEE